MSENRANMGPLVMTMRKWHTISAELIKNHGMSIMMPSKMMNMMDMSIRCVHRNHVANNIGREHARQYLKTVPDTDYEFIAIDFKSVDAKAMFIMRYVGEPPSVSK